MKKIIPEFNLSTEQLNKVFDLAQKTSLLPETVKILYGRGIDTSEKIFEYIHPSSSHFIDPFKMQGMKEICERIRRAIDNKEMIVVYGDYDADGICATTILGSALKKMGADPFLYVPERAEGYGLSTENIDKIMRMVSPDLFITVDCGISNHDEVEYIKKCGAEVFVTDHHELPDLLPECVCINPKFDDDYPYDNLCGAGVAFKIACALLGEEAYKWLDMAAVATMADSVPLTGENRDIVSEGIALTRRRPRKAFSYILGKNSGDVTAQTLAFSIAPRINAAGRMGDANSALRLFMQERETEIIDLANKLNAYNMERQRSCDELYQQAKSMLSKKGVYSNVIMLAGENWNSGFVGIIAARLTEEYNRPALLFVKNGDMLKGSARSIDEINIYEALKACSFCIEEFGGHSQAAGVNILPENFDVLENALNAYIGEKYPVSVFDPKIIVTGELDKTLSLRFAKELDMLEPFGIGNRRPLFSVYGKSLELKEIKNGSSHLSIKHPYVDLMYFGGAKFQKLVTSEIEKQIIFEINLSLFKGKQYIKGYVRDIIYRTSSSEKVEASIFASQLRSIREKSVVVPQIKNHEQVQREIDDYVSSLRYGLCVVAGDINTLQKFDLSGMECDIFNISDKSLTNCAIVAPLSDVDFSGYKKIIYLDCQPSYSNATMDGKEILVCSEHCGYEKLSHLETSREVLLNIFAALKQTSARVFGMDFEESALSCKDMGFRVEQVMFALAVFEELGLISFAGGRLIVYRGIKAELKNSEIYSFVNALKDD